MKVEIWSDVICPFCYIGKRRFEESLRHFNHFDEVEIEWKSFQLHPAMKTDPEASINDYLADEKGWTKDQIEQMNRRITEMAAEEGLQYNLEQTKVANSFDAHRLIQYAKTQSRGDKAEEALFSAYFTEGKNIGDREVLLEVATAIGLDAAVAEELLEADNFSGAVEKDVQQAHRMNIRGVPFFLFNRQFAISGAQQTEKFVKALEKSWKEEQPPVEVSTLDEKGEPG